MKFTPENVPPITPEQLRKKLEAALNGEPPVEPETETGQAGASSKKPEGLEQIELPLFEKTEVKQPSTPKKHFENPKGRASGIVPPRYKGDEPIVSAADAEARWQERKGQ